MRGPAGTLERIIEAALTTGLLLSGGLLLWGLGTGLTKPLRWGVLVLMLTPVVRVVVVTAGLLLRRDWIFALLSLWVLAILGSSLALSVRL